MLAIRHEQTFTCLLSAKLGRIFIVKQPVMSWYGYKLTNARHNVDMPFLKILSILIFSLSRFNGRPTHFWPGTNVKINEQSLILKQPSAGAIVEASSNLFAIVKTTALEIFAASPLRKKSWDFFRLRSNSEVYSSSISDCTAHNVAYCDVGNGTPQRGVFSPLFRH